MSILFNKEDFESLFFDFECIDFHDIDTDWTHDFDDKGDEWNSVMIIFGFKELDCLFNVKQELKDLGLNLKRKFHLPEEYIMKPKLWIQYIPQIESYTYELRMFLYFDSSINDSFIDALSEKEKDEVLENVDRLFTFITYNKAYQIGNFSGIDELSDNMRRLANLLYFQRNSMTIYEYLKEIPMLDSEVNHEEIVKRTTQRLKRLHRQVMDYTLNKYVPHPGLFVKM